MTCMLEPAAAFHARALAATDDERRLPVAIEEMPGWDIFPFEPQGLRYKPLSDLEPEPPRRGEDPQQCWCAERSAENERTVWSDDDWVLGYDDSSQLPCLLVLQPRAHHDLPTVPDRLAARMGVLEVAVAAGIEELPSVGRVQLAKWGDGGAHLHLVFLGRPAGMLQLRGSCLLDWAESMPVVPTEVLRANALAVAEAVAARAGGRVHGE